MAYYENKANGMQKYKLYCYQVTQRTVCLEPAALWVVIAAKELGISQGFPPGGQYTKVVLTRSLFNDSISAKKILYRSEKQC
jgi:hypothetical protein